MKKKYFPIIIEDISEGKEEAFAITLPDLHNSVVMGETYDELAKGIKMTFEAERKKCDPELLKTLKTQLEKIIPASKMTKSVLY
jgi:hypothetical protein